MEFGLRPNAEGAGAHASVRGEREREFGGIIAVGSIEDDQEIAVARGKIDVLDLHPDLPLAARRSIMVWQGTDRLAKRRQIVWTASRTWLREAPLRNFSVSSAIALCNSA